MNLLKLTLFAITAALLTVRPALADTVTYSILTTNPTVAPDGTVTFNGSISAPNSNSGSIYLIDDSYTADSPLIVDDTDFLLDAPSYLAPGESYLGPLFDVTLPSGTKAALYGGHFDLILGIDDISNTVTDRATFQISETPPVNAIPEPSSWLLLATGMAAATFVRPRVNSKPWRSHPSADRKSSAS